MKRVSRTTEGALVLVALSLGLLLYGYVNERLFSLGGATFPGVALLVIFIFSAWAAISRDDVPDVATQSAAVDADAQGNAEPTNPLTFPQVAVAVLACCLYLLGLIYVGVIVTTAVTLAAATTFLAWRFSFFAMAIAIVASVVVWFVFSQLGRTYFPPSWLF